MKRVGYLYEQIFTHDNISLALDTACKNKQSRSVVRRVKEHREEVIKFIQDNPNFIKVHNAVPKYDTSSGKTRDVVTPDFIYLIRQHCIIQVIYPIFSKSFYHHSYGAIRGKGILRASKALRSIIRNNPRDTRYAVSIDTRKYYDSVDIETLKGMLARKIKDTRTLDLLYNILGNRKKGIPIGNYTSQIFANIYFTPLDHYIKEKLKVKVLFRQMDDILITGANKRKLKKDVEAIRTYIKEVLKCDIHDERIEIKDLHKEVEGQNPKKLKGKAFIDFCAYKHYEGGVVTIRKRIFNRLRHTIFALQKHFCLKFAKRFMSYWGYVKNSNSSHLLAKYMPMINMANMRKLISTSMKGATI